MPTWQQRQITSRKLEIQSGENQGNMALALYRRALCACAFVKNRPFKCCIKLEFPDARRNLFSFFLRIFRSTGLERLLAGTEGN